MKREYSTLTPVSDELSWVSVRHDSSTVYLGMERHRSTPWIMELTPREATILSGMLRRASVRKPRTTESLKTKIVFSNGAPVFDDVDGDTTVDVLGYDVDQNGNRRVTIKVPGMRRHITRTFLLRDLNIGTFR